MFNVVKVNRKPDDMDFFNLFEDLLSERKFSASLKTDIRETPAVYEANVELPGFKKEDIKIEVERNSLIVSATRKKEEEKKDGEKIIYSERSYGSFTRTFDISNVNIDEVEAKYEDGILKLVLPKKNSKHSSHTIEIK